MINVVKEVITALIIVPTIVFIDVNDKCNNFNASLYPNIIIKGKIMITGIKNTKAEN